MASTKYLSSVDIFKFIAAIMVVAIHTNPFISNIDADFWITSVCRIAVPFFFVVGSYFYFKSNRPIWDYIKRLLLLYLVWFIIEIPFIYERFFIGFTINEGIINFMRGLLIHNTFYASWYITASWQATLIVYVLSKRSEAVLYLVGIACAFFSVSNALYAKVWNGDAWIGFTNVTSMCCASNSFVAAVPYCIIGRYVALNEERLTKARSWFKYLLFVSLLLGCIEIQGCRQYCAMTDSFWSLYLIAFVLVVLLISSSVLINKDISVFLRKMSILIYLTHGIVIRLLRGLIDIDNGLGMFLITVFISALISYVIVKLSTKIRLLKLLY